MTSYNVATLQEEEASEADSVEFVTREMLVSGKGVAVTTKDLEASCWGVTTLSLIRISSLKWTPSLMVKIFYSLVITIINAWLQFTTLWYVNRYIVGDSVHSTQSNYRQFHAEVWNTDETFNDEKWKVWTGPYMELCNLAMSKMSFTVVILFMWSGRMVQEVRDIIGLVQDLCRVVSLPKGAVYGDAMQVEDGEDGKQYSVVAMGCCTRLAIFGLVIIPKCIICVILLLIGSRWLVATESYADLILNALALEFVIGTDELVYEAFSPNMLKKAVESTKFCQLRPADEDKEEEDEDNFIHVFCAYGRSLGMMAGCLLWVWLYMQYFQQVIPGYPHDIAPHCEGWFDKHYDPICPFGASDPMETCFPYGTTSLDV
mmetsp:Transcript_65875/g.121428  ORF Transcript_65875/g.121428 Transcript_65875/m.121428 type:complete len:373 (-) Transcript_65875:108-1226(-)